MLSVILNFHCRFIWCLNKWKMKDKIPLLLSNTSVLTAPALEVTSYACLGVPLISIGSSLSLIAVWLLTSLAGGGTGVTTGLFAAASLFTRSTWIGPLWLFKWIWYFFCCWIELGVWREKNENLIEKQGKKWWVRGGVKYRNVNALTKSLWNL